ncbi:Zinc finger protein 322 [Frankliniella fusca]|uniref:Zinc finger protein 322 n=1 Tax=Frankliniella fusca TaxID=407009 RepID=A0AAE1H177_9NEOP|nr:Zinc finger protein 322 [Frankliniella fusca]
MALDEEAPKQFLTRLNSILPPFTCRLCLFRNKDNTEIVGSSSKATNLINKISRHLSFQMSALSENPTWICKFCKESVESFDVFSCTVLQIQEHLSSLLAAKKNESCDPILIDTDTIEATIGFKRGKKAQQRKGTKRSTSSVVIKTNSSKAGHEVSDPLCSTSNGNEVWKRNCDNNVKPNQNPDEGTGCINNVIKTESVDSSSISESNLDINSTHKTSKDDDLSSLEDQDWVGQEFSFEMDSDDDRTWKPSDFSRSKQSKRKKMNPQMVKSVDDILENSVLFENECNVPESDKKKAKIRITATHGTEPKPKTPPGLRKMLRVEMHTKFVEFYGITCDVCVKKFRDNALPEEPPKYSSFDGLCEHMQKEHNERGYVKCCNSTMRDRKRAERHMLLHTQPGSIFKCNICGKQLSSHQSFRSHILLHLPDSERPYQCNQCERGFVTKTDLSNHERQHLPEEQRYSSTCDICGSRFCYDAALALHKQRVHENYRPHLCDLCPKSFKTRSDLDRHKEQIHGNVKREQCLEFKGPSILKTHMRQHKGQVYKCQFCDKTYSVRSSWKAHLVNHSDEKPHKCPVCEKCFKLPGTLKMHLNQHTGDLPYGCQFCPKRFASSGNYYTHRKRMHREQLEQIKAEAEAARANGLPPPISLPPARTESISEAIARTKVAVAAKEKDVSVESNENTTLNLTKASLAAAPVVSTSCSSTNSICVAVCTAKTYPVKITKARKPNSNSSMPLAVSSLNSGNTPIHILPSLKHDSAPEIKILRIVSPDGSSKLVFVKQEQFETDKPQSKNILGTKTENVELRGDLLPENVEPASVVTEASVLLIMSSLGFVTNRCLVLSRTAYLKTIKRTFLSDAYQCREAWNRRLESPIMKKVNLQTLYREIDFHYSESGKISAIDADIFFNANTKKDYMEDVEDVARKLRRTSDTSNTFPSSHHAITRTLLDSGKDEILLKILNDRLTYGIYPDNFCLNLLMDSFLKQKKYAAAARVAVLPMLQEDWENPLTTSLSIYSCHMYVKNSDQPWYFEGEYVPPPPEPKEVVKIRIQFLKHDYFDNHFDIKDPMTLVGKTLSMFSTKVGGSEEFANSYSLLGLTLQQKWDHLTEMSKELVSGKRPVHREILEVAEKFMEVKKVDETISEQKIPAKPAKPDPAQEAKEARLKAEQEAKLQASEAIRGLQAFAIDTDLLSETMSLVKDKVKQLETKHIEEQKQLYSKWEDDRLSALRAHQEELRKEEALQRISQQKEELTQKEREIFFFDIEDKLDLMIEEKELALSQMDKKVSKAKEDKAVKDAEYVPPEVFKRAQ